ncbi:MAG: 4Fe-4S binding protein, partial [Desulfobacteraceae bacterium]|nr:4Fe-4S binding protein [Desulfobacteraceae bacterium]
MKNNNIHFWRRTTQIIVAVFFIVAPLMNARGFSFVWGNFLNIHVGPLTFSDPLAVLQVMVNNHYMPTGLLIGAGLVLGIAFFLGTVFCSWICPFGLLSEWVNLLSQRFLPDKKYFAGFHGKNLAVKAGILVAGLISGWLFFRSPILNKMSLPFQYANIFQYLYTLKYLSAAILFIAAVLMAEFMLKTRIWCKWICPQSVLLTLSKQANPFGLKINFKPKNCVADKALPPCRKACSLDLDPRLFISKNQSQCTNCGD